MIAPLSERVRLSFIRGDKLAQIFVNERTPSARTVAVALKSGYQACVRETDLRFVSFLGDIENNVRAGPFAFGAHESKLAVQNVPNDSFARNQFCDLLFGVMRIFVTVCELGAEFVAVALNFSRPPSTNIVDGSEDLCRRFVYRNSGSEVLFFHELPSVLSVAIWP
jgi:hypothetical protein